MVRDIYLAKVLFTDGSGYKIRPILLKKKTVLQLQIKKTS